MNVSFGSLEPGAVFYSDGRAYKKLDPKPSIAADPAVGSIVFDNAITIGRPRNSARFAATDRVDTADKVPLPSWWRRKLMARALRWHLSGFTGWARWSWRLARLWSRGNTEMRLAAYATQLMMMGE
jgi:hypothetical protein